mmetsp:Transcript_21580/g.36830  ORF Transcript_21580/g.36830 Transcript_21580/m.36830 type:complete len:84 (+) Transcript_21580:71-322(+)
MDPPRGDRPDNANCPGAGRVRGDTARRPGDLGDMFFLAEAMVLTCPLRADLARSRERERRRKLPEADSSPVRLLRRPDAFNSS